jgi:hypothetical protein
MDENAIKTHCQNAFAGFFKWQEEASEDSPFQDLGNELVSQYFARILGMSPFFIHLTD